MRAPRQCFSRCSSAAAQIAEWLMCPGLKTLSWDSAQRCAAVVLAAGDSGRSRHQHVIGTSHSPMLLLLRLGFGPSDLQHRAAFCGEQRLAEEAASGFRCLRQLVAEYICRAIGRQVLPCLTKRFSQVCNCEQSAPWGRRPCSARSCFWPWSQEAVAICNSDSNGRLTPV